MYESIAARLSQPKARVLARASMRLAAMVLKNRASIELRRTVMGLSFPGPVGLAAGFDKHGALFPSLPSLGFGFAEIGSVIPLPEPRRSHGLDAVMATLSRYSRPHQIPLGISISMNRKTPPEKMANDYLICMQGLWKYADYITLNLGVRAGPDLHQPEHRATLRSILTAAKSEQTRLTKEHNLHRPVVVKVDQARNDTDALLDCVREFSFDGLILSGEVCRGEESAALANLEKVVKALDMPVISVGGIRTPDDATNRLSAGACLVQIYSGIVESGPLLPRRINARLLATLATDS